MKKLSSSIESYIRALCPDADKLIASTKRNAIYVEGIRTVWKDELAAKMILEHTNAVYILEDDRPK